MYMATMPNFLSISFTLLAHSFMKIKSDFHPNSFSGKSSEILHVPVGFCVGGFFKDLKVKTTEKAISIQNQFPVLNCFDHLKRKQPNNKNIIGKDIEYVPLASLASSPSASKTITDKTIILGFSSAAACKRR